MDIKHSLRLIMLVIIATLFSGNTYAIVIDFNGTTQEDFLIADYFEDGFRMQSLEGHYDFRNELFGSSSMDGSNFLIVDNIGTGARPGPVSIARFDFFGDMFSLESLEVIVGDSLAMISSSAGGMEILDTSGIVNFMGSLWSDITWIDIAVKNFDGPSGVAVDSLVFTTNVPEPGTIALMFLGVILLSLLWKDNSGQPLNRDVYV